MSDSIAIAASGLKAEQMNLNRLANDLANLNTNNYKASTLKFDDVLYQSVDKPESLFSGRNHTKIGLGTAITHSAKDFTPGPLKSTANWNDVAINGDGFFQVILADGNLAYTRASTLRVDNDHYLSTDHGLRLSDNLQIPEDFVKITIHKNGDIEAVLPDDTEPQFLGRLKLAKFMSAEQLNPLGEGLYRQTEEFGDPLIDTPGQSGLGELIQGQIETSNVDMVSSLMQLTLAQRNYQINAKALQIADEMEKEINEIRA